MYTWFPLNIQVIQHHPPFFCMYVYMISIEKSGYTTSSTFLFYVCIHDFHWKIRLYNIINHPSMGPWRTFCWSPPSTKTTTAASFVAPATRRTRRGMATGEDGDGVVGDGWKNGKTVWTLENHRKTGSEYEKNMGNARGNWMIWRVRDLWLATNWCEQWLHSAPVDDLFRV